MKPRYFVMAGLALLAVAWYFSTDPDRGADTLARLQWLSWGLVVVAVTYPARRLLARDARVHEAVLKAMESPIGAGLVFLGLMLLTGFLFLGFMGRANASELPPGAVKYLPALNQEITGFWPGSPLRSALAAQVEQESCVSLKSPRCWSPTAELKTAREYGFGFGQITIAKNAQGGVRFDNFAASRTLDSSLRNWQWADRFDAGRQLRVLVLMDRQGWRRLPDTLSPMNRMAMTLSGYNGGIGSTLQERRMCAMAEGCNPDVWFGNVELHSNKSRTVWKGYGKSAYAINREYPRAILGARRIKYKEYFNEA